MPAKKEKKGGKTSPAMGGKSSPKSAPSASSKGGIQKKKAAKGQRLSGSRNKVFGSGFSRFGSGAMYHKSGKWAIKNKKTTKKAAPAAKEVTKTVGGKDNGGKRVVAAKESRFYPTEDVPKPLPSSKANTQKTKLRPSIQAGQVLILLAGRFRGKRVVFLKQLESGLLLVTGPYKINGVPLRRVNQAYVIATSTRLDISKVNTSKFNDAYFKKPAQKAKKSDDQLFASEEKKKELAAHRVSDQKDADKAILAAVKSVKNLKEYLNSRFTLTKTTPAHELKF